MIAQVPESGGGGDLPAILLIAGGLVLVALIALGVVWFLRRRGGSGSAPAEHAMPAGAQPGPPAADEVPAGWHPDPHGERRLRYWDGTGWTEHTAD